jgi:hypothetical protein
VFHDTHTQAWSSCVSPDLGFDLEDGIRGISLGNERVHNKCGSVVCSWAHVALAIFDTSFGVTGYVSVTSDFHLLCNVATHKRTLYSPQ